MGELIRSFIAIELPPDLQQKIDDFNRGLKQAAPEIRWLSGRSIHITLKFLGEQPPERMNAVIPALMDVCDRFEPFQLTVSGFGAFPDEKRPRVFWLGVRSNPVPPLYALQNRIEEILLPLGFDRENRRFSPHLTLARVKFPGDFAHLWKYTATTPFPEYTFPVKEIVLMRSLLKPTGALYKPLQKYSLHRF